MKRIQKFAVKNIRGLNNNIKITIEMTGDGSDYQSFDIIQDYEGLLDTVFKALVAKYGLIVSKDGNFK